MWRVVEGKIEAKQTPKRSKKRPSKGLRREAKTEWRGLPERCVTVGEIPTGSNMH